MPGLKVTLAPAFNDIPPQYTPGESATSALAVKLCLAQPEGAGKDELAYGSDIGAEPLLMPCMAVMSASPVIPPTTPTESAVSFAEPPSVSALASLELS